MVFTPKSHCKAMLLLNRGDRIRTCDLVLPKGRVIQRKYWESLLAYRIREGM